MPAERSEPTVDDPMELLAAVGRWMGELVQVPFASVRAYLPGADGLRARTREQLILAVTDHGGSRTTAWVHGSWLEFVGDRDPDEALAPLFTYARSCAEHGRPLDTTTLLAVYPPAVVRSVRATVARGHLENLVARSAGALADQARGRRRFSVQRIAVQAGLVAGAVPFVVPMAAVAGTMRIVDRLAPSIPDVITPDADRSNLVVDLVAEAVPTYLGSTIVRTGLLWSPVEVSVAFRIEGRSATLTVGRGKVRVDEDILPSALLVVDGGGDALLPVVAGSLASELTASGQLS